MPRTEKYFIGPQLLGDIRRVVGRVESEPYRVNGAAPKVRLQDMRQPGGGGGGLRICEFTGSWAINTVKVLNFSGVTTTPNTVAVNNALYTIGDACTNQFAYVGKIKSDWHLLNVQHHETAVIVSVTLTTAALEFTRRLMWIPYPGETATLSIPLSTDTACSS